MAEKEYLRLTRARPRAKFAVVSSGNSSLWLGKDHLLCIDTTGYTENYKRFYFRDIQAFVICKTNRYQWWAIVTGVMAVGCAIPAVLTSEVVVRYILGIMGGLFLLFFFVNLALGPSSMCQLQTAVHKEELPSLNRLRRARKVLDRLRPMIIATQGALSPEDISIRIRQSAIVSEPAIPTTASAGDSNVPPQIV